MRQGVLVEAAVVGVSLAAVSAGVMFVAEKVDPERKVPVLLWVVAAGALTHLAWEASGGNAWFAKNYVKTLPANQRGDFLVEQGKQLLAG